MDTLYIVIPAYNESENIKRTIEEWCPVVEKHNGGGASRLVIINDGSRDDTYEIASAECETHPLLTVLTKPNGGHGSTVLYGYRYARKRCGLYLPDRFRRSDRSGGVRKVLADPRGLRRHFRKPHKPRRRLFPRCRGKVLCAVLWTYFHVSVPDANAPFRLMKTDYVASICR